jgi:hypothetical protein
MLELSIYGTLMWRGKVLRYHPQGPSPMPSDPQSPKPNSPLFTDPHDSLPLRQIVISRMPNGLYKIALMTERETVLVYERALETGVVDIIEGYIRSLTGPQGD